MSADTKILAAGKYSPARSIGSTEPRPTVRAGKMPVPLLFIPTVTGARNRVKMADWYWKEIKEGGFLCEYLASEKRTMPRLVRRVARVMDGFQQNNKSDFRRLAAIPARVYHRWKQEDEHFFDDDNNLRSLKRDNEELAIYVGPKRVRGERTVYGPKSKVQSLKAGETASRDARPTTTP